MADIRVDGLTIYPIKSLRGISVRSIRLTASGPEVDRRWMLVDGQGNSVTQRENPILSLCNVLIDEREIVVDCEGRIARLPLMLDRGDQVTVKIWGDTVAAIRGPIEVGEWFSDLLGFRCIPVYMPDKAARRVNPVFAPERSFTTFTDGFPVLVASTSSLEDLNRRLDTPVPMSRFRANVVVKGGEPFDEDFWGRVVVGTATLRGVKPCSRCVMTTIDAKTLVKSKEPLKTLATYRKWGNHVYFGENFIVENEGEFRVGDLMTIETMRSTAEVARRRI